jgi:hypothetical protein
VDFARPVIAALVAGLMLAVSACGGGDDSTPAAGAGAKVKKEPPYQFGTHTVRVGGLSSADVAAASVLAVYPPGASTPPRAWVMFRKDRWREGVLGAQFAVKPISSALLVLEKDFVPTSTLDVVSRITPSGFPKAKGLQTLILNDKGVGQDVFIDLQERDLQSTQLLAKSPAQLAFEIVPFHGGGLGRYSPNVVIASSEEPAYAVPAAAWAAFSGDALAFANRRGIPPATAALLAQREKLRVEKPTIYVIGPEKVIPASVMSQLAPYGTVKRIAGRNAVETSVELARYKDRATAFGWGVKKGPASVSLVNAKHWGDAVGAWNFAAAGPQAPLLLTDSAETLPKPVADYVRSLAGVEPNQGYVFGDSSRIGAGVMAQLDQALERR